MGNKEKSSPLRFPLSYERYSPLQQVLFTVLAVLSLFLMLPIYLVPLLSFNGPLVSYSHPIIFSSESHVNIGVKAKISISAYSVAQARSSLSGIVGICTNETNGECPSGFVGSEGLWPCGCVKLEENILEFIHFDDSIERVKDSLFTPRESFYVPKKGEYELILTIKKVDVSREDKCNSTEDCQFFLQKCMADDRFVYRNGTEICVTKEMSHKFGLKHVGCSMDIVIGTESECLFQENIMTYFMSSYLWLLNLFAKDGGICTVRAKYLMLENMPSIILRSGFLDWSSFISVPFFICFYVLGCYRFRRKQLHYLNHYYQDNKVLHLVKSTTYHFKLYVTGIQSGVALFDYPFSVFFEDSDFKSSTLQTVIFRGRFMLPEEEFDQIDGTINTHIREGLAEIEWAGSFERAGYEAPLTQLVILQKVPWGMKTRFGIFNAPIIAILHTYLYLVRPSRRHLYHRLWEYFSISLFAAILHTSFLATSFIYFSYFVRWDEQAPYLKGLFWGYSYGSFAVVPFFDLAIFILTMILSIILHAIPVGRHSKADEERRLRKMKKQYPIVGMKEESSLLLSTPHVSKDTMRSKVEIYHDFVPMRANGEEEPPEEDFEENIPIIDV